MLGKEKRHTDTVKVFIDAGVDPSEVAGNGKTCLQMTQNRATSKLIKSLLLPVENNSKQSTTTSTKTEKRSNSGQSDKRKVQEDSTKG